MDTILLFSVLIRVSFWTGSLKRAVNDERSTCVLPTQGKAPWGRGWLTYTLQYSHLSQRRTPSGRAPTVRLREAKY